MKKRPEDAPQPLTSLQCSMRMTRHQTQSLLQLHLQLRHLLQKDRLHPKARERGLLLQKQLSLQHQNQQLKLQSHPQQRQQAKGPPPPKAAVPATPEPTTEAAEPPTAAPTGKGASSSKSSCPCNTRTNN